MDTTMQAARGPITPSGGSRPRSPWYRADDAYRPSGYAGTSGPATSSGAEPPTLRLDANEGRPLPGALDAIRKAISDPDTAAAELCRYTAPVELEAAIAERWSVEPERVVVCAGADDAMDRVCSSLLAPGSKALRFDPDFEMFARRALGKGASLVSLPWLAEGFPLRGALELVERCPSLSLSYLASPNNPTGLCAARDDIMALARACGRAGCAFMFDAAYGEFAPDDPSAALIRDGSAFVLRTFSKAYGLAGLRVGYAIAPDRNEAQILRAAGSPYPVSNLAQRAAKASLAEEAELSQTVAFARLARGRVSGLLAGLGLSALPSEANFVLARCGSAASARILRERLARSGIALRSYPEAGTLGDCVRVSCPVGEADLARLERALSEVSP